jgi:hypothetical protein
MATIQVSGFKKPTNLAEQKKDTYELNLKDMIKNILLNIK